MISCQHVSDSIHPYRRSLSLSLRLAHRFCCVSMPHHHFSPRWQSSHMSHPCLCVCVCMCDTSSIRNRQLVLMWQRRLEVPRVYVCVCVYVCECLMSARWPLMTPTHRKWHMSALRPRVTNNLTFSGVIWHIQFWPWLLWSWTAETKRVLFHRRSPCSDGRGLKFECISICVSSLVFVDTWWHAASLLNACSSEELSLPEHWRAGQLHSLD